MQEPCYQWESAHAPDPSEHPEGEQRIIQDMVQVLRLPFSVVILAVKKPWKNTEEEAQTEPYI